MKIQPSVPYYQQKVCVPAGKEGQFKMMTVEQWARTQQGLTYRELDILRRHESVDGIAS